MSVAIKGLHLKNEYTDLKKNVFALCNQAGYLKKWKELNLKFNNKKIEFQVIYEN